VLCGSDRPLPDCLRGDSQELWDWLKKKTKNKTHTTVLIRKITSEAKIKRHLRRTDISKESIYKVDC
jgi:hypothetical protein